MEEDDVMPVIEHATDEQIDRLHAALAPLFADAVAQGMHAPFALDCERWGDDWADRAVEALTHDA